jgi:hypothetical protein
MLVLQTQPDGADLGTKPKDPVGMCSRSSFVLVEKEWLSELDGRNFLCKKDLWQCSLRGGPRPENLVLAHGRCKGVTGQSGRNLFLSNG